MEELPGHQMAQDDRRGCTDHWVNREVHSYLSVANSELKAIGQVRVHAETRSRFQQLP